MEIRIAKESDRSELEEFLVFNNGEENRRLAHDYIQCMFSKDYRKPTFVVAVMKNRIIGAAAYSEELFTVGTWGISWVSVHENYRNQGIGGKLVEACLENIETEARERVSVILCTYPDKTRLYEKAGFTHAGHDHIGGSFMVKNIGADEE